ncbi:glutathione S-transferase family protein [Silicimonas algicola]|uniref:Glutathione S-transferase n=1 Tax=Silicimonas algicola TaxID=1826607 RepID=A0A316G4N2_9RHOB|nr:glutathione S-transferase family protein [Silicimonas algicola]AZQ65751.1 glutathione S-transferase family protein [Silicimonas algicola]PWK54876.1 glutathione S-transferase [Silicimonas algicola]
MTDLTLYSMPSSGNSYKVRLLLALLGRPYRHLGMEYESTALAAAHSMGALPLKKLPVLELADGTRIPESNAILCYLADGTDWMPSDPVERALTLGWMFWEQNQHEGVIAVRAAILSYESRRHLRTPERLGELLDRGHALLAIMDEALRTRDWIAIDRPTVADISLYGYTHSAGTKGGFDLARFPAVQAWLARVEALPGHVGLIDIPA